MYGGSWDALAQVGGGEKGKRRMKCTRLGRKAMDNHTMQKTYSAEDMAGGFAKLKRQTAEDSGRGRGKLRKRAPRWST
jgi:hypothetical protein